MRNGRDGLTLAVAIREAASALNPIVASPSGPIETVAFMDSFGPSLMPHTSVHQGTVAGLSVLSARSVMAPIEMATRAIVNEDDPLLNHLLMRGFLGGVGHVLSGLPVRPGEPLTRSGVRTAGLLLRAGSIGGAFYDISVDLRRRYPAAGAARPMVATVATAAGVMLWANKRFKIRKSEQGHWPIPQPNELLPAAGIGLAVAGVGAVGVRTFGLTRREWQRFLGDSFGARRVGAVINTAMWAGAGVAAYNYGVGYIGRANEKVEPGYAEHPSNEYVSGGPASISPYSELGQQGRRFVTDILTPEYIDETMGESGAKHPIRVFVGYNSNPMYSTGRAEMALAEMERLGAFDREYLLLVSPTGTGWVDQTMIESAELFARGDVASVCIQYGRFPSFLSVQKVALGRSQFRLLLWGVRQRLAERKPENRPKVLVFGESLGAWTSSDVVMFNGIQGFDHYGIDKALWVGLPWMAKWSRSGIGRGANELVPEGTVGVFDRHELLAELSREEQQKLRAVVLSHDNDPIAVMGPDLMIRKPEWLGEERGRGVPHGMRWEPFVTFMSVALDAANAMVMVPGEFGSFGHDYRGDMARFVLDGLDLPRASEEQIESVEKALRTLELERGDRISAENLEAAPPAPAQTVAGERVIAGIPLRGTRTSGSKWLKKVLSDAGVNQGDLQ
jgi:uncharacterized membrane protein